MTDFPADPQGSTSDPFEEQLRTELAPELELIRHLGRGSMATVYLAREVALRRLVAIKVLKPSVAVDPIARRRFEREAQSVAQISHRNVTSVYRVGRLSNDIPYLVMEYVEGRNLDDVLTAEGPLSVEEGRRVLGELALALAAAHEKGIIHRDVKPGNVIREKTSGRAVLTDFGIAAILASGSGNTTRLTQAGQRLGDLRYMSPEQLKAEPVTEQADVYSFGILAYELLTGEGPYRTTSVADLANAHLRQPPTGLAAVRPEVDGAMAALLERCLAKKAEHRPTAVEVARVLTSPPDGSGNGGQPGAVAVPESALGRFFAEVKRRRVYQVAVGYLAAAFVVLQGFEAIVDVLPVDWLHPLVVTVALGGFPVALVLSWMFDVTSAGIQRTEAAEAAEGTGVGAKVMLLQVLFLGISLAIAFLFGWWILGS